MMDIAAVGSDLTSVQQEETMADLAFFLHEFGSTRTARVKLKEQKDTIRNLGRQVRRLLNYRDGTVPQIKEYTAIINEGTATKGSEKKEEDVNETMAGLDFFLKTYGSTRVVREQLENQRHKITGLQRTLRWLRERRQMTKKNEVESDVEYVGTRPASTSVVTGRSGVARATGGEPEGVESPRVDTAKKVKKELHEVIDLDSDDDESAEVEADFDGVHCEYPKKMVRRSKDGRENAPLEKANVIPMETFQQSGGEHEDRQFQSSSGTTCADKVFVGVEDGKEELHQEFSDGSKHCGQLEQNHFQQTSTAGTPVFIVLKDDCRYSSTVEETSAPTRDSKPVLVCRYSNCSKKARANGWCRGHSCPHVCKIQGCSKKAIALCLCTVHGGGRTCQYNGCERLVVSGGKGFCRRHAREHGIVVNGNQRCLCKEPGCTSWGLCGGTKRGDCFRHGGGLQCKVAGCTRQRQRQGLCATHGGFLECRANACRKRTVLQGYCHEHRHLRPSD